MSNEKYTKRAERSLIKSLRQQRSNLEDDLHRVKAESALLQSRIAELEQDDVEAVDTGTTSAWSEVARYHLFIVKNIQGTGQGTEILCNRVVSHSGVHEYLLETDLVYAIRRDISHRVWYLKESQGFKLTLDINYVATKDNYFLHVCVVRTDDATLVSDIVAPA